MFLKRFERRKSGKRHTYWALVESYRTARGSRHRVVSYLGELSPSEQSGWACLGAHLKGESRRRRPQRSLFDPPVWNEPTDDEPVLVQLSGVRLERPRDFGDVWLAWGLWRMLGLDSLLEQCMSPGREEVPWPTVAAILTIARLCEPSSELHIADTWYRRTALEDLLGVSPGAVHTFRLYGGLDQLLPHKEAIEKHLRQRLGELFPLNCDLLLYDVTSTYFEGDAAGNPQAQRGYSRDSRPDCQQVCIGLVVTDDGYPVGYEVFAGNRHDSTTIPEIVNAMERKYGRAHRVWVLDRGMVSEDNLKLLRDRGAQYIVGTPKAMLRKFEEHLTEQGWEQVREGIDVKLVPGPGGNETFLLARSADRGEKERAMHDRFVQRMEERLRQLAASTQSGRLKDAAVANQRLGRLRERYWRANNAFDVTIRPLDPPRGKQRLEIVWTRRDAWRDWSELSEGCYLLRSNLTGVDAPTLWRRYIQLTEAEWAFRIHKDELSIRPIWHHREDRVQAHILVCFLAYVLWKTLAGWMRGAGMGDAPRTVLEEFARIQSADVVLPTKGSEGMQKTVRLRCVTEPDPAQKVILHRLGLPLPRRLRRIDKPVPM